MAQKINITTTNASSAAATSSSSSGGGDVAAAAAAAVEASSSDAAAAASSSSHNSHTATVADGNAAVAGIGGKGDKDLALLPGTVPKHSTKQDSSFVQQMCT